MYEARWVDFGFGGSGSDFGEVGLYNLNDDLAESNNLKDQHPEKFQELDQLYSDWFAQMGDPAKGTKHYEPKAKKKKKK